MSDEIPVGTSDQLRIEFDAMPSALEAARAHPKLKVTNCGAITLKEGVQDATVSFRVGSTGESDE